MQEEDRLTAVIINDAFELAPAYNDDHILAEVRKRLIERLDYLLNHDFEKLLWILYRIDVKEEKAKSALAISPELNPSEVLADLIIERSKEKARTRLKFRKENDYNVGE